MSDFPPFPAGVYPAPNGMPGSIDAPIEEPVKRRGRPRRDPSAEAVPAAPKQKRKKVETQLAEQPDNIQCLFRTLQQPDLEPFSKVYDILLAAEGRSRILAVLNQVLA